MSCSRIQCCCSDGGEARTHSPSVSSQALYHWAHSLRFYIPVNSYGHVEMVSNQTTFFLGKLDEAVNQYFMYIILLVNDNNLSWISWRRRMTIEIISWSISTRDQVGIKLATPGSAVRLATHCATGPSTFRANCLVILKIPIYTFIPSLPNENIERKIWETSTKLASSREKLSFLHAYNKGTVQTAHSRNLISPFAIPWKLATCKFSRFEPVSEAELTGLSITWSKIPKDSFSRDKAQVSPSL